VKRVLAASLAALLVVQSSTALAADPPARPKIETPGGIEVKIVSTRLDTRIYLAHGQVERGGAPELFEKLGVAPITLRLAPGTYTMETSSESTSLGYARFSVDTTPLTIEVRPGDETVKTIGTVFEALGITAALVGVLAAVAFSKNDANYDRWAIALPLLLGGAGVFVGGLVMSVAGSTRIVLPTASSDHGLGLGVTVRF
jgi:hypothetical protein